MTDAEVIASTDAGSFPGTNWFSEIVQPLLDDPAVDAVGGRSENLVENDFQRLVVFFQAPPTEPTRSEDVHPSSRNIAFRRQAWADVGGYPEWLTLTAEDSLFNFNLHKIGCRFHYNRDAVVAWPMRENARAYFKMLRGYGYGAAEAQLFAKHFRFNILMALCPWLLLLSRHRTRGLWFRYRSFLASSTGWVAGWLRGHRPPADWKRCEGVLLSPEAQRCLAGGKKSVVR
jgi:cellulose synthase/poly-beta-1,6-N-acetylglucosamine synthase-like glycosyltransferase